MTDTETAVDMSRGRAPVAVHVDNAKDLEAVSHVTLDGRTVWNVISADEHSGMVTAFAIQNEDGSFGIAYEKDQPVWINPDGSGLREVIVHGYVHVQFKGHD